MFAYKNEMWYTVRNMGECPDHLTKRIVREIRENDKA